MDLVLTAHRYATVADVWACATGEHHWGVARDPATGVLLEYCRLCVTERHHDAAWLRGPVVMRDMRQAPGAEHGAEG